MMDDHTKQTAALKEQIKQHALTIVSLEERAKKTTQEHQSAKKEVRELEKKLEGRWMCMIFFLLSTSFLIKCNDVGV